MNLVMRNLDDVKHLLPHPEGLEVFSTHCAPLMTDSDETCVLSLIEQSKVHVCRAIFNDGSRSVILVSEDQDVSNFLVTVFGE